MLKDYSKSRSVNAKSRGHVTLNQAGSSAPPDVSTKDPIQSQKDQQKPGQHSSIQRNKLHETAGKSVNEISSGSIVLASIHGQAWSGYSVPHSSPFNYFKRAFYLNRRKLKGTAVMVTIAFLRFRILYKFGFSCEGSESQTIYLRLS